jgi:transposase
MLSAISTHGTVWRDCVVVGLWLILTQLELKMMKNPVTTKAPAEQVVKDIRRATRKLHSSEEKIRIVLSGLRGEDGAWSRH